MDVAAAVEELDARLRAAADPDRAPAERAYLKSDLTHLGVGVPGTRRAVKVTLADHGPVGHDDLIAVVDGLWAADPGHSVGAELEPVRHQLWTLLRRLPQDPADGLANEELALLEQPCAVVSARVLTPHERTFGDEFDDPEPRLGLGRSIGDESRPAPPLPGATAALRCWPSTC
jgi:hypothetical protein